MAPMIRLWLAVGMWSVLAPSLAGQNQTPSASLQGTALQGAALQGTWRVVEITYTGSGARTVSDPQPGLLIFTKKHYSQVEITSDVPRVEPADLNKATADELRGLWSPLRANSGEYEISGDTFTKRAVVAKNETTMRGAAAGGVYRFRVEGDTLWTTLVRDVRGSVRDPFTTKYLRLE